MEQDKTYHGDDVKMIKEWLAKQAHLPQNIDDMLLKRYLHVSSDSIEKAKALIDLSFTIRSQAPEIFDDRDPKNSGIQEALQTIDFLTIPGLTEDGNKIFVCRLKTDNVDRYNFVYALKAFFLFSDVRFFTEKDVPNEDILIFDMKNFTLKHITKIVLSVLKKYMVYNQEAHPVKLKEMHLLNTPPFLDKWMTMMRPFMKNEVIYSHLPNSETLFQHVPKECLPQEYGGTAGKCEEIRKYWCEKLMENRDYLLDQTRWKVDETKRPPNNKHGKQLFGVEGSFRALNID